MKKSEFEFMVLDTIMRQKLSYPRLVVKMANKLSLSKNAIKRHVKDTLKDYKRLGLLTLDESKNFKFLDPYTFAKLFAPSPRFKSKKFNFGMMMDNNNDGGVDKFEMFAEELAEASEEIDFDEAPMTAPFNPSQTGKTTNCISLKPKSKPQDLAAFTNLKQKPSKFSPPNEATINKRTSLKIVENFSESKKEMNSEACRVQQNLETISTPSIKFDLEIFKILNGKEVQCEFKIWKDKNESTVKENHPQATDQPTIKSEKTKDDEVVQCEFKVWKDRNESTIKNFNTQATLKQTENANAEDLSEQHAVGIISQIGKENCVECQDAIVSLSQVEGFKYPTEFYCDVFNKYYIYYHQKDENTATEPSKNERMPIVLNSERVYLGRLRHLKKNPN